MLKQPYVLFACRAFRQTICPRVFDVLLHWSQGSKLWWEHTSATLSTAIYCNPSWRSKTDLLEEEWGCILMGRFWPSQSRTAATKKQRSQSLINKHRAGTFATWNPSFFPCTVSLWCCWGRSSSWPASTKCLWSSGLGHRMSAKSEPNIHQAQPSWTPSRIPATPLAIPMYSLSRCSTGSTGWIIES